MARGRQARIILAIVAGTIGLAAQTPARAAPVTVKVVDISGPSPFAPDGCGVDITQLGSEYEPDLAVNPKDQRNIIAIWSQDKQISNVVATSQDGGEHWTQVLVPGLSKCTGGTADSAFDARLSFGSDGTAYLSSPVTDSKHGRLFWTLLVTRSTDGGLSWSDPVTIDQAGPWPALALDFPVLVADPRRSGTAYVVWSRFHDLFTAPAAPQFFARTTDGGVTWTPPAMIPITPQPNQTAFASQIRVLSDGTLINVFIQIPVDVAPIGPTGVWAMRSQDQGDSWSTPIFVADIPETVLTDPDNGRGLGRGGSSVTPSVAVGGNKEVYVVWHLIESTSSSRILFAKSLDGGATWSAPAALAVEGTQAFLPTVAVSPSGAVGVTYFDFRDNVSGDQQLTTDLWFRHSQDDGATWSETHVAGPFDIRPAPSPGGFPLGDYFGLQPIGRDGFGAVFVQTISPQTQGVTDVFFAQVQVPPAPQAGDGSGCTMSPGHTDSGHLFAWLIVSMLILWRTRRRWHLSGPWLLRACVPRHARDRDQKAAMKDSDASGRARSASSAFSSQLRAWPHTAALACALLLVTNSHPAQAGINVWTSHGPGGGSAKVLAVDPTSPETVYAGTDVGVFRSTDGAGSWVATNTGLISFHIAALMIARTVPSTLYAATDAGVFKSTDGARSWLAGNTGLTDRHVNAIAVDPATPDVLYAGTGSGQDGGGVFKSTDGASTWTAINVGLTRTVAVALAIAAMAPSTLYAATNGNPFIDGDRLVKSTDAGGSWQETSFNSSAVSIAIDPFDSRTLYFCRGGVFRSTDGASTWEAVTTGLNSTNVQALAIDPTTPSTLYAGAVDGGVFKSTDGALTWHAAQAGLGDTAVSALAIDPTRPRTLYAGGDGAFKSTDGADTWRPVNGGLTNTRVSAIAIDPIAPATLYSLTDGPSTGLFKSIDGATSWQPVTTFPSQGWPAILAVDPIDPTTLYAVIAGILSKSTDGGTSWAAANAGLLSFPVALAIDPISSATLYVAMDVGFAGPKVGGVFKSTDGANSWTQVLDERGLATIAIDPTTPTTLYAATGDGMLFKSTDGAGGWTTVAGLPSTAGPDVLVTSVLAIDPITSSTLYAGNLGGGVFKSTDGAGSWQAVNIGLADMHVGALAINPQAPATLYAGTDGGVFKSTDGAGTWSVFNTGLPDTFVFAIAVAPTTPGTLYALTDGSGIFEIEQVCVGDCHANGQVTIDELVTLVRIAIGSTSMSACDIGDVNHDGQITVNEIVTAVNLALEGCP